MTDFSGRVAFRRRFGYPGRIDGHERVWLTFEGVSSEATIRLNDRVLGQHRCPVLPPQRQGIEGEAFEFEVTPLLRTRNELVVEVDGTEKHGGLWGEVALEVRCTAFLRELRHIASLTGDRAELRVTGKIVGAADRPLELYLVLDRSVAAYQVVSAAAEGTPFEIVVPDVSLEMRSGPERRPRAAVVQVDLVNGASVWYTNAAEVTFEPRPGQGG